MEGSRFDRWTRRRVGKGAAGLLGALAGQWALPEAEARHRKKHKKNRCIKLAKACVQGHKPCCKNLACEDFGRPTDFRCCKTEGYACSNDREDECCPDLSCFRGFCAVV
jgi:hypothetical protein